MATSSRASRRARRPGRDRRDRALHGKGHPAQVRQGARSRHHRHRDGLSPLRSRRHRVQQGWRTDRLRRHRHLARHDVHGRAQHGLGLRLLPGELDAPRRPDGRLRLPHAQPHGQPSGEIRDGRNSGEGQGHEAPALDRSGKLQSGLSHAQHASPAQARRQVRVAAHAGLLARRRTNSRRSISTATNSSTRKARPHGIQKGGSCEPPFLFSVIARSEATRQFPVRRFLRPSTTILHPPLGEGQTAASRLGRGAWIRSDPASEICSPTLTNCRPSPKGRVEKERKSPHAALRFIEQRTGSRFNPLTKLASTQAGSPASSMWSSRARSSL